MFVCCCCERHDSAEQYSRYWNSLKQYNCTKALRTGLPDDTGNFVPEIKHRKSMQHTLTKNWRTKKGHLIFIPLQTRNLRRSTLSHAIQMRQLMAETIVKIGDLAASFCEQNPESVRISLEKYCRNLWQFTMLKFVVSSNFLARKKYIGRICCCSRMIYTNWRRPSSDYAVKLRIGNSLLKDFSGDKYNINV